MTKEHLFSNVNPVSPIAGRATRDSVTGKCYSARNQVYVELAPALGLNPDDQYGWYTLCRMFPRRFIDIESGKSLNKHGSVR